MKRDLDLIRDILLFIEKAEHFYPQDNDDDEQDYLTDYLKLNPIHASEIVLPEVTEDMIYYHLLLLGDAGYIVLNPEANENFGCCYIDRLTMAGCEYLDTVRDEQIWQEAKNRLSKLTNASLEIAKTVAQSLLLARLGL